MFDGIGHLIVAEILRVFHLFALIATSGLLAEDDLSFSSYKSSTRREAGIAIVLTVIAVNAVVPADGLLQRAKAECVDYDIVSVLTSLAEAGTKKTYMGNLVQTQRSRNCKCESRVCWWHLGPWRPSPAESTSASSCKSSRKRSGRGIQGSRRPWHHLCHIPMGFGPPGDAHCRRHGRI